MRADDLQVGDVIFFVDNQGLAQHVAVYAGKRADTHFITHATSEPYNSIITTRLKPDHYPYRVFRPANFQLAVQTALRLRIWSEHGVPYSYQKADFISAVMDLPEMCHPKTGGEAQSGLAAQYFIPNFYRYIEIAAHPSMPYFPHANAQEGMRCTEAVVTAFNVQSLLMIHAVKPCTELGHSWVSDYGDLNLADPVIATLSPESKEQYFSYLQRILSGNEYSFMQTPVTVSNIELEASFPPAIIAWNYKKYGTIETFVQQFDFPLPLDAKIATSPGFMAYLQSHPQHWHDRGELIVQNTVYPLVQLEANKDLWRDYVRKLFAEAETKRTTIRERAASPVVQSAKLTLPSPEKNHKRQFSLDSLSIDAAEFHPHEVAADMLNKQALIFTTPPKSNKARTRLVSSASAASSKPAYFRRLFPEEEPMQTDSAVRPEL